VRRLGPILGYLLAALSLLLSIAVAAMWVRSHYRNEKWCRWRFSKPTDETQLLSLVSERGKVEVTLLCTKFPPGVVVVQEGPQTTNLTAPGFSCSYPNGWWYFAGAVAPPPLRHSWEHLGVFVRFEKGLRWGVSPGVGSYTYWGAPYWLLFALTICGPALCGVRWWRSRLFGEGRCANCGYDLRESPERCPECGAAVDVGGT